MSPMQRRSIRLPGYNYSKTGAYFITLVTENRLCLFGEVIQGAISLSRAGLLAKKEWLRMPGRFMGVELDEFVIMPNHLHGIIWIKETLGQGEGITIGRFGQAAAGSLATILRSYKSAVTYRARRDPQILLQAVWQRNYYEHIVRSDNDLARARTYIRENPTLWSQDHENPQNSNLSVCPTDFGPKSLT